MLRWALCTKAGNSSTHWKQLQRALQYASRTPGRNLALGDLAAKTGQSSFHAHRMLRAILGETPKHFTLRLRIDRAAAALISSRVSVLDIALACGFESHEVFCRAFRRRFRMSPSAYRRRARMELDAQTHANWVNEIGPCVGLYHIDLTERFSRKTMPYTVTRQERAAQPVLVVRRRIPRAEIAATIGSELPKVFLYAQQHGIPITGYPITRYLEITMGFVTLETGMRVTAQNGEWILGEREGDVLAEMLPAGPAAVTIHSGPYDQLPSAYAALEEWIVSNGFCSVTAPWEAYLNDPTDHPDPQDWKTEVCWPLQA